MATYKQQLIKFTNKNKNITVDIHAEAINKMSRHLQINSSSKESGGILLGYMDKITSTINIVDVTEPQHDDFQNRIKFIRKSNQHILNIQDALGNQNFYIGNWHTHPEYIPTPSPIDKRAWQSCLLEDKIPFHFQIYIICGISQIRIWLGNEKTRNIVELFEADHVNGLY